MKLSSRGVLESYRYFCRGLANKPVVYHVVSHKLPQQWGYAVCAGMSEVVRRLEKVKAKGIKFEAIEAILRQVVNAEEDERIKDYLQHLEESSLSFRADGIPDGSLIFGSQPVLQLMGPASLVSLFAFNFARVLQNTVNTATNLSRLRILLQESQSEAKIYEGLFQEEFISEAAMIAGAEAVTFPLSKTDIPVIVRFAAGEEINYADHVYSFTPVEDLRSLDKICSAPKAILLPQRAVAQINEFRAKLASKGFTETEVWVSTEGLAMKAMKTLLKTKGMDAWLLESYGFLRDKDSGSMAFSAVLSDIDEDGHWQAIYEEVPGAAFRSYPGVLNIRRFYDEELAQFMGDMIYDESGAQSEMLIDDQRFLSRKILGDSMNLFEPLVSGGMAFLISASIEDKQFKLATELSRLDKNCRAIEFPSSYRSGMEENLYKASLL